MFYDQDDEIKNQAKYEEIRRKEKLEKQFAAFFKERLFGGAYEGEGITNWDSLMKQRNSILGKEKKVQGFDGVIEDQEVVEENMNINKKD